MQARYDSCRHRANIELHIEDIEFLRRDLELANAVVAQDSVKLYVSIIGYIVTH